MRDQPTSEDTTAPARFCLPADYQQRARAEYFTDDVDDGVTWQPDVYPFAADLAAENGRNVVIDIGCGRAAKLAALATARPQWQYIGVDFGPNIDWCIQHHQFGQWIDADLETCTELPIPASVLSNAVIICSDVLEHLIRPDVALALIHSMTAQGAGRAVLSTPAREHRAGTDYIGPPRNPAHIREWTSDEFRMFLGASGFEIHDFRLTRSDDRDGGLTTQLATVGPVGRETL